MDSKPTGVTSEISPILTMIGAGYALETQIPHILFFRVQG
jgi:hypothetical protein